MLEWRELAMFTLGMLVSLWIKRRWPSLIQRFSPPAWGDSPVLAALPGLAIMAAIGGMAVGTWLFALLIPAGLVGVWLWIVMSGPLRGRRYGD